jgi:hypothetical protein
MNNPVYNLISPFLEEGVGTLNQNIQLLLYKKIPSIFDFLDFENELIYQEPLFFAYFNNQNEEIMPLEQLFTGFSDKNKSSFLLKTDNFGRIYIPNIGWLITQEKNIHLVLHKKEMLLKKEGIIIDFTIEPPVILENTSIELIKYPIPLLNQCFFNVDHELVEVEIEEITQKHLRNLTKAYQLIQENVPTQFKLIEKYAFKCVVFNVDTYQRNSFATMKAQGVVFYNAYQEDYNEVFFLDDIAHQTGHVIFNTLLSKSDNFFKVKKETILEIIKLPDGTFIENRDLNVLFHALYTYYTSFVCLDACLSNNVFDGKQKHEAMGRIAFYLNKCYNDLLLIDAPVNLEIQSNNYFTEKGLLIYKELKNKWKEMYEKWNEKTKHFDMTNQPYNFTYSNFLKLNKISNQ